jgi:iron complex transport system ATP-binding protein
MLASDHIQSILAQTGAMRARPHQSAKPPDQIFELRDVAVLWRGRPILTGIDWLIRTGERWVVLGPNGSGKTTLVQVLSTYLMASRGDVHVLGHRVGETMVSELRKDVGYLSPALDSMIRPEMRVADIVDAAQQGALVPWSLAPGLVSRVHTERALAFVGLSPAEDRPYSQLGSGEQLRVQLARTLVNDPQALLLDEPTSHLDIRGREALISTLNGAADLQSVRAIVLVVHRVEDIPPNFTHVLLMRDGEVVSQGRLRTTLTSAAMSECFGIPLRITRIGNRYSAVARHGC